ncbi:HAAS signaling domain-containing protein [Kribbella sp. NPDC049174]|uniref:HAAS signaling domain-containing protein n=1 Tax=Kribbella sp. NPDC049174 TaxID=3364112 RepID=UPI0037245408
MSGDQLVEAYLKHLSAAAESLPVRRRDDLVAEVTSHIAEARAAGATSESEVRQVLARLGDPADIVAAATDGLVLVEQPPRLRLRDFAALALLVIGPFVLVIGWLAGVWLLWTSDRWTRGQKLLGTLAWPLGYAAALISDYVLVNPLWVSLVVANLITIGILVVLAKSARPGQSSAAPADASPVASGNS